MTPAVRREDPRTTRLLRVDSTRGTVADGRIGDLPRVLRAGDLFVVNDAATLPASLAGVTSDGTPVEARLAGSCANGAWRAVLFGAGDWRTRTEDREPPPRVAAGDALRFDGMGARVVAVDARAPRLVALEFDRDGDGLWRALYRAGRPVQYAHTAESLALWDVQTGYASRPWAAEAPSAGFALTWELLIALRRGGVGVARVTHAAGLSSTGDAALDARLPFAERYEVTAETAQAVESARARGDRVVAAGTTVARALESAARTGGGAVVASRGMTDLLLGPTVERVAVDAILTGVHEPGTSHFELLAAFSGRDLLVRAFETAEALGYRGHEFGDAMLVMGG
jgi:S-adenosylmethionine:tRNA ribosyltransferase-isomerase